MVAEQNAQTNSYLDRALANYYNLDQPKAVFLTEFYIELEA